MEGDAGLRRRQRPRKDIDGQQSLYPPARAQEEGGQQQGQEHRYVHAEANKEQSIDDRWQVEPICNQVDVK